MTQTKPCTAMQAGKRFRRIQSMAGPIPRDARASCAAAALARGWKAAAFRAAPDSQDSGKWLEDSIARFLFPASGLHAEGDDASGNPESKAIAEGLLKAAGQPGMHARFLREFKALADEIYWSEGEIAFIDSAAVDAESGVDLTAP